MAIRAKSSKYLRNLLNANIDEARGSGVTGELFGLETEPHVGLRFAHLLVLVGSVIDDQNGAARTRQRRQLRDRLGGARRVVQHARGEHRIGRSRLLNA